MKPTETLHMPGVDPRSFRCCLCFHVKTGTLIYGVFIAFAHIIVLGLLVFAAIHPDVLVPQSEPHYDGIDVQTESGISHSFELPARQRFTKDNLCVLFGISLVFFVSTLALIYGVARNLASYLMPFFCLQVFDFCLSCLTVVGCFTYAPNIKQWIHDQNLEHYPGVDHLMTLDSDYLMLLFVTLLILFLSVKAYLIGMVWSCYKYIQLHVASRSVVREYSIDPDTEMLLPPKYEDAIKISNTGPQPPAYSQD